MQKVPVLSVKVTLDQIADFFHGNRAPVREANRKTIVTHTACSKGVHVHLPTFHYNCRSVITELRKNQPFRCFCFCLPSLDGFSCCIIYLFFFYFLTLTYLLGWHRFHRITWIRHLVSLVCSHRLWVQLWGPETKLLLLNLILALGFCIFELLGWQKQKFVLQWKGFTRVTALTLK